MTLPRLRASDVERIAGLLSIQHHETGARAPWEVNTEQRACWRATEKDRFVYVAKARQVGLSTAVCLEDVLWTATCDAAGHRVRCAIVVDTFPKSMERLLVCEDFGRQLGLEQRKADNAVRFPNGSEILALSASADEVGRSLSVQRLHLTELPFWADPAAAYTSLMQGLSLDGSCIIETTMETRNPFARDLWRAHNDFRKVFLPVEMHDEYRMDPASISDERWADLRDEGYTRRDAAAWFDWAIANKVGGDVVRAFREYPQREEHLFQAAAGRVIAVTPPLAHVDGYIEVPGLRGDTWNVEVYGDVVDDDGTVEPIAHSGQVVVTVDTAYGVKKTNSVVLATDKRDRRVLACFWSNEILHDDLARVAAHVRHFFSPPPNRKLDRVELVVEDDGIGSATCTELTTLGVPHERFHQGGTDSAGNTNSERCVTQAKRRIEAGMRGAPLVMLEECDELHRDERKQLKGRKDCIMMFGLASIWIDERPFVYPPDPVARKDRANRIYLDDALRAMDERRGKVGKYG